MHFKSIIILSLLIIHCYFVNGKACNWQLVQEWHTQPSSYTVNWTVGENICEDLYGDCWTKGVNTKMNVTGGQVFRQICPLQIQLGDILVISAEPSLHFPEMNLMNVSEASFIDCLKNATSDEDQLLFSCNLKGNYNVNPLWLSVGTHYFITVMASGPSLCQLGLRLNVTVKQQLCQESPSEEFCSGHGKCLSDIWNKSYTCRCQHPFSGKYCQELDVHYFRPCKNNDSCINKREKFSKQVYESICHRPLTGLFCNKSVGPCIPLSSWEEEIWQSISSAYTSECLGLLTQSCETDARDHPSASSQNGAKCKHNTHDGIYICAIIFTKELCKTMETSHDPLPSNSNTTCVQTNGDYQCSVMLTYTGKDWKKAVDYCKLLSINCLDERWTLNITGRFRNVNSLGYVRKSCWFVEHIDLNHQYPPFSGNSCCMCQIKHLPSFQLMWQLAIEGSRVSCSSLPTSCSGHGVCVEQPKDTNHTGPSPCEGTLEVCASGCRILSEEKSQGYRCLCTLRWTGKLYLVNMAEYQENWCQQEDISKDEVNRPRCSCFLGRLCLVNAETTLRNWTTSEHALGLACLHNCNCSCLHRSERNICKIEMEDYKSAPEKNGTTSPYVRGFASCPCLLGLEGKYS